MALFCLFFSAKGDVRQVLGIIYQKETYFYPPKVLFEEQNRCTQIAKIDFTVDVSSNPLHGRCFGSLIQIYYL